MRLILVPLMFAVVLAVAPVSVHANGNQAAAEKIAASLGDRFPGYDIAVSYQNGKVRLVGQVASPDMMHSALEHVQRIPGVPVSEIDNGLRVVSRNNLATPSGAVKREVAVSPVAPPKAPEAGVVPVPAPAKAKRSIWSPQAKAQVAGAPMPIPAKQEPPKAVVVQVSNREAMQQPMQAPAPMVMGQPNAAPLEYAHPQQMQPMQMGPPQGMPYQGEAYGPQGPMPGQYNQPNLPDYAWPSYACYPNYAEVCYPKQYSPKAWPFIGPFYPYPQAPLGWRKVTMEHHDGWWWLDFDDGPTGPFSPLFRQPVRYTY